MNAFKSYCITFMRSNFSVATDIVCAKSDREAIRDFKEIYRHGIPTIISIAQMPEEYDKRFLKQHTVRSFQIYIPYHIHVEGDSDFVGFYTTDRKKAENLATLYDADDDGKTCIDIIEGDMDKYLEYASKYYCIPAAYIESKVPKEKLFIESILSQYVFEEALEPYTTYTI